MTSEVKWPSQGANRSFDLRGQMTPEVKWPAGWSRTVLFDMGLRIVLSYFSNKSMTN